ncbi:hypothetical protein SUGI_0728240 [Cryptomeria japonica]|nr:hypothetical protein SUGI_0728240 [Cryptomeria japonica]
MAEDLNPLYSKYDLDLTGAVRLDHNNLDKENTQQIISHSGEVMKRKTKERIALTEKVRRQKMRNLLSTLQSLLPNSTNPKGARHCIIEETGRYIQNLQSKAQELQKKKAQLLMDQNSSAIDVGIEVYNNEIVIIRISASRMPRSLCKIYEMVEKVGLEIERADVYRGESIVFLYFYGKIVVSTDGRYSSQMSKTRPCLKATLQKIY